jgi:N4-(beta-N-acetylglucosaminyl)-L-asparaginase
MNRRTLLKTLSLGGIGTLIFNSKAETNKKTIRPLVISTWHNQGVAANTAAWSILNSGGSALDAVELGVQQSENDINNCCVGLGANPDREGIVTLDASIMDHMGRCGAVAFLEGVKSPTALARRVMEKTPHVLLVGNGAQQFAREQGMEILPNELSSHARKTYENWLIKSEYKPVINIERSNKPSEQSKITVPPAKLENGEFNHDTIGMVAIDSNGNLSGACTTSGMAFKMRGRVGDSPIIGAGLYVDNKVGAATSSGNGEEVIRTCGSFLVVEFMRQGYHPTDACKKAVQRLLEITPTNPKSVQIGFIAINKAGEHGGFSLNPGFDYTATSHEEMHQKHVLKSILK